MTFLGPRPFQYGGDWGLLIGGVYAKDSQMIILRGDGLDVATQGVVN